MFKRIPNKLKIFLQLLILTITLSPVIINSLFILLIPAMWLSKLSDLIAPVGSRESQYVFQAISGAIYISFVLVILSIIVLFIVKFFKKEAISKKRSLLLVILTIVSLIVIEVTALPMAFLSIYAAIISIICGIYYLIKYSKKISEFKKLSLVWGLTFLISGVISLYLIPISTFFKNPSYDPNLISPKQEVYWVTNSHLYAFTHNYGLSTVFLGEGGSPELVGWDKEDNIYYSYYAFGTSSSNVYRKNIAKNSPAEDLGSIDFLPKGLITSKSVGQNPDFDCKDPIYIPRAGSACNEFSVGQTEVQLESGYIIAIKNSLGTTINYVHFVRSVALSPDEKYLAVLSSLGGGAYATGDIFYIKLR